MCTKNNEWIPVKTGKYPEDMKVVQVTYLSAVDGTPMCNGFAYRSNETWYWFEEPGYYCQPDEAVVVKVTAWKPMCEPYREDN